MTMNQYVFHRILRVVLSVFLCVGVWLICDVAKANSPTLSQLSVEQQLDKMEQQLFGHMYQGETSEERLNRIESTVFGAKQSAQVQENRLKSLQSFFKASVAPISGAPPAGVLSNGALAQQNNPAPLSTSTPGPSVPALNESQYPAVTAMEQRVFQQAFEKEAVENRLARLEARVMGRPQGGTLQERTDQLRMMVLGDVGNGYEDPSQGTSSQSGTPSGLGGSQTVSNDVLQALPQVEQRLLRQTFPNDSVDARLGRLEQKVFKATAPEMSPDDRFYRIVSVASTQTSRRDQSAYSNIGPGGGYYGSGPMGGSFGLGTQRYYGGGYMSPRGAMTGSVGSMLLMLLMSLI